MAKHPPRAASYNDMVSLHRYFIWANRMRTHFEEVLGQAGTDTKDGISVEQLLYMSYWYAGLFVVIEGWRALHLRDSKIDKLLTSPNVALLKKYRDGVFHYQRRYWDERFLNLITKGQDVAFWVRNLNHELGRYLLEWSKSQVSAV